MKKQNTRYIGRSEVKVRQKRSKSKERYVVQECRQYAHAAMRGGS